MAQSSLWLAGQVRDVGDSPSVKTAHPFLDFVVDGQSLIPEVNRRGYDLISPLWTSAHGRTLWPEKADRLMGRLPGDAPGQRVSIFVCGECGDLGCGAITVQLTVSASEIVWADWGYQNDYDDEIYRDGLDDIPTLRFDRSAYEATMSTLHQDSA